MFTYGKSVIYASEVLVCQMWNYLDYCLCTGSCLRFKANPFKCFLPISFRVHMFCHYTLSITACCRSLTYFLTFTPCFKEFLLSWMLQCYSCIENTQILASTNRTSLNPKFLVPSFFLLICDEDTAKTLILNNVLLSDIFSMWVSLAFGLTVAEYKISFFFSPRLQCIKKAKNLNQW